MANPDRVRQVYQSPPTSAAQKVKVATESLFVLFACFPCHCRQVFVGGEWSARTDWMYLPSRSVPARTSLIVKRKKIRSILCLPDTSHLRSISGRLRTGGLPCSGYQPRSSATNIKRNPTRRSLGDPGRACLLRFLIADAVDH